ncbi:hypothetical protein [Streptomyces zagrosensis]|uniref:Uncharacterized protein n=1 Tax=Streptomyces zagrosensis TaxID=1042984 RepID=A0A7W9UYY9_9ACTN|nr:hypothetical protein [Streptomyces zagrosensis]MBB5936438.1 hypothetical protein [Streptomyces zagrosensis]
MSQKRTPKPQRAVFGARPRPQTSAEPPYPCIGHLTNWRALARHHDRREHMSDNVQAVARLLSHQRTARLGRS